LWTLALSWLAKSRLPPGALLRLVADSVTEPQPGSDPQPLQSDPWLGELVRRTPHAARYLADLKDAAIRSHALAGSTPPPEHADEGKDEDEVDVTDVTPIQLGAMLAPLSEDGAGLPRDGHEPAAILQTLEELVDKGKVVMVNGRYLARVSESPALYALAAESRVKHDSSRDEVIEHLISAVLTED